jgi:hypothetical protein
MEDQILDYTWQEQESFPTSHCPHGLLGPASGSQNCGGCYLWHPPVRSVSREGSACHFSPFRDTEMWLASLFLY